MQNSEITFNKNYRIKVLAQHCIVCSKHVQTVDLLLITGLNFKFYLPDLLVPASRAAFSASFFNCFCLIISASLHTYNIIEIVIC